MAKEKRGRREPFVPGRPTAAGRSRPASGRRSTGSGRHRLRQPRRPSLLERLSARSRRPPEAPPHGPALSRDEGPARAPGTGIREAGPVARSRRFRRLLRVVSFGLLLGLAAILFLTSSAFGVTEIVVTGGERLGSAEIVEACGVNLGTNIFKLSTGAIRERLLTLPRVSEASVSRRLPGTLVVSLAEREGVALLPCQQQYAEIDPGGLPLEFHRYVGALGLPVITGVAPGGVTLGTRLDGADLVAALGMAAALGQEGRARISEIHVTQGELVLYSREGLPVYIGQPVGLDAKVATLLGILDDIAQNDLEAAYVDVQYPRYPVVGAAGGPPEPAEWQWDDPDSVPALIEP